MWKYGSVPGHLGMKGGRGRAPAEHLRAVSLLFPFTGCTLKTMSNILLRLSSNFSPTSEVKPLGLAAAKTRIF